MAPATGEEEDNLFKLNHYISITEFKLTSSLIYFVSSWKQLTKSVVAAGATGEVLCKN
jgi:hypothetical protein